MIKRRFYKLEHGDKDSGSDSSCFSSDSDPEIEESEDSESESEDAAAQVSEDDDSGEEKSPAAGIQSDDDVDGDVDAADGDDSDAADGYRGRLEKTSMNRDFNLEEPPEEEEENYILGCMFKCKSVYKCRYCPKIICLNEISMQAHVSSKKHSYLERLHKEANRSTDDEEVDDPEEKQIKGNRRARRQDKSLLKKGKLRIESDEVEKSETPSQIKGNRRARRQGLSSQKQGKGSLTTQRESAEKSSQKSRKKRRQTKD